MGTLKNIFGPSKDEIWGQIANEINGEYIHEGFWMGDKLRFKHDHWEIVLDTYTQSTGNSAIVLTRLRVPFVNKDGLQFKIFHESFFTTIGKIFGMQDIQIGDRYFDDQFIIKGNNEPKIKRFLNDRKLKDLFRSIPKVSIEIKNNEGWFGQSYPDGVDVLYFECIGVIKDKLVLKNLFELFSAILDRLVKIDSAYKDDPRIQLK